MRKNELENYVANLAVFVSSVHDAAGLPIPEDFNPEEQAVVCRNAIAHKAKKEYANQLLMANNTKEELEDLTNRMTLVSENSTDQTLGIE